MKKLLFLLIFVVSFSSCEQTSKEYHERGMDKAAKSDYTGAIADFTKAIEALELIPSENINNIVASYSNRAKVKSHLKDYTGALADYNKAIELDPKNAYVYSNRGSAKNDLKDYYGAIADQNKSIELDPNYALAYYNRAFTKELLGIDGCADARKAKELGHNAYGLIYKFCN